MANDTHTPGTGGFKLDDQKTMIGYLMDEDSQWALRDTRNALGALSRLLDGFVEANSDMPEVPPGDMAALVRTFERSLQWVIDGQKFADYAEVRPGWGSQVN